jgi:hypothetical protein
VLTPSATPLRSDHSSARSTPRSAIKEQIAAKRRELQQAHRANKSSGGSAATTDDGDGDGDGGSLQDSLSALSVSSAADDQDIFGRSLSHLIHKSLRTGRLNICSMELERLPKQLWTKVLGMPDNEITRPSTPPVGGDDDETVPSYEVEDLTQLKAASNMLKEIEPEIGWFGSLRILDVSGPTFWACAERSSDSAAPPSSKTIACVTSPHPSPTSSISPCSTSRKSDARSSGRTTRRQPNASCPAETISRRSPERPSFSLA